MTEFPLGSPPESSVDADPPTEPSPVGLTRMSNPIFVIGSPRSGTTALAVALGAHPALWAGVETKFVQGLLRREVADKVYSNATSSNEMWLNVEGVSRAEWLRALGTTIETLMASRAGGRRWIDHAPRNTMVVDNIATALPTAKFIHIIRDGRRVVESLLAVARRPGYSGMGADFAQNCERWVERVAQGRAFSAAHPERCLEVTNEELSLDPETRFRKMLEFLGEDDQPDPSRMWRGPRVNSSFDNVRRPEGPWGDLDRSQRQVFVEIAGPLMIELGYLDAASSLE